jgi:hypothetical protein
LEIWKNLTIFVKFIFNIYSRFQYWTYIYIYIMTYRSIARQRLGKHIPAGANARNNRTSIARQQCGKHASSKREGMYFCVVRAEELPWRQLALQDSWVCTCGMLTGQRKLIANIFCQEMSSENIAEEKPWLRAVTK